MLCECGISRYQYYGHNEWCHRHVGRINTNQSSLAFDPIRPKNEWHLVHTIRDIICGVIAIVLTVLILAVLLYPWTLFGYKWDAINGWLGPDHMLVRPFTLYSDGGLTIRWNLSMAIGPMVWMTLVCIGTMICVGRVVYQSKATR